MFESVQIPACRPSGRGALSVAQNGLNHTGRGMLTGLRGRGKPSVTRPAEVIAHLDYPEPSRSSVSIEQEQKQYSQGRADKPEPSGAENPGPPISPDHHDQPHKHCRDEDAGTSNVYTTTVAGVTIEPAVHKLVEVLSGRKSNAPRD